MSTVSWVALAILVLMFGYILVRAMSVAYFKTRLEYLRSALKELRKEENRNG